MLLTKGIIDIIGDGVLLQEIVNNESDIPFSMSIFSVRPNSGTLQDQHLEQEYWVILAGSGLINNNSDQLVKKNDICYFKSNESHSIYNNSSTNLEILSIYW